MSKKKYFFLLFIVLISLSSFAQVIDSSHSSNNAEQHAKIKHLSISGYVDAYYAYYTDSVGKGNFQKFPTVSPRSNSIGLNIAMLSFKYTAEKVRATIAVHYGDIVLSSWAPAPLSFLQEAHIGIRLQKKLWLDAGFFRSHIGTEGLFAKENITSSLAVGTYNEPYFEAGARLNYSPSDKLAFSFYLLNGYNMYIDNNNKKSFGMLVTYAFNDFINIGYSNYIGDDSPIHDTLSRLRIYHNLFLNFQKNKFKVQLGGDFGTQSHSDTTGKKTAYMFSALATIRYAIVSKFGMYVRGEFFNDPSGFLGGQIKDNANRTTGYKLWGATVGAEFKPTDNSYIRIEGRQLQADANEQIFRWNGKNTNIRQEAMIHLGYYF